MKPLRILIADDHEVVREGTRLMLESEPGWEVCGVATTGREAVEQAKELRPDIAVLDMSMPDLTGLEAARKIKRASPSSEVIIFTATESKELIRDVFESGAKSYILKADVGSHLVDAVKSVSQHKPFFTSKVAEVLFAKFLDRSPDQPAAESAEPLSPRERDVVRLLAEGKSNKEVANLLGLSVRTAETHRANVMHKLGVSSLAELVRYAVRNKLVES
jgi:DNA-binding NarL/FixJ family response regulator